MTPPPQATRETRAARNLPIRRGDAADLAALVALQHDAYRPNAEILGVEPLPLQADYADIVRTSEVWVVPGADGLAGALILKIAPDHLLIWSVSVASSAQGCGLGGRLLAYAEERARQLGLRTLRLYMGEKLRRNVEWYRRNGYGIERIEVLPDRRLVHMIKAIG
jgi:ribosomal protein S18 acetylase RimI-like enzyme